MRRAHPHRFASLTIARLISEIEISTKRISHLVQAIKEYSYMDQAAMQEVDLHQGLENTLTILHHRLKGGINVVREYDENLPKICAYGGELNQIWTNLISNAIEAMQGKGELRVRTGARTRPRARGDWRQRTGNPRRRSAAHL